MFTLVLILVHQQVMTVRSSILTFIIFLLLMEGTLDLGFKIFSYLCIIHHLDLKYLDIEKKGCIYNRFQRIIIFPFTN
jgi:hypothetical protein